MPCACVVLMTVSSLSRSGPALTVRLPRAGRNCRALADA
jgi:hypothetical protein